MRKDAQMIDGLKIQMTAAELAERLNERIDWHEATASEYEAELRKPEHMLEHELKEHRERAGVLRLVRDHLIAGELYLLEERDLQFADLVPEFNMEYVLPRRPPVPEVH